MTANPAPPSPHLSVRPEWLALHREDIIDPALPIVDPHHHLWDRPGNRYFLFDLLRDIDTGHNIRATVAVEAGAMYRSDAAAELRPVGETEFLNGAAAMSAGGEYGACRVCAGIVGHADLLLGDAVAPVLEALMAVTPRFKGIRHSAAWDADPEVLGAPFHAPQGLYLDAKFREGFRHLGKLGLSFDAWLLEPQLGDVLSMARAFPDQPIVLDHCGTPLGIASYQGKLHERFDTWREAIRELGKCPNVSIKLGGLAMYFAGLPDHGPEAGLSSETLAAMWRPYIETCIEAFGPDRAMFESNYPVDRWGASYPVLWNAFKRLASGASADEKRALFAGTAARVYGIEDLLA